MKSIKQMLGSESEKPSPETPPEATQTDQDRPLHPPNPESESAKNSSTGNPYSEEMARGAFGGPSAMGEDYGGAVTGVGPHAGAGDGLVSKEDFCGGFVAAFDITAQLTRLQSLAIADEEKPQAMAAGEGLYLVARKHPSLHWLLKADGPYLKLALVTLPFAMAKARMAAAEIALRRNPSPAPENDAEAA